MVVKYYCQYGAGARLKSTDDLLDECYQLVIKARGQLPKTTEYQIHIVLPRDDFMALHYALAQDKSKLLSVTNSDNPFVRMLFGAVLHESQIADKVFVF